MEISVRAYASDVAYVDYNAIVARFGTPQQIAESCVMEMETSELLHGIELQKNLLRIVFLSAAIMIALWIGIVTHAKIQNRNISHGYYEVEVNEGNAP